MFRSLSGRFLILTMLFVMLAEVLIFVPSIARFRYEYFLQRLERAQIASLTLLGTEQMLEPEVEAELLKNAGVLNVVLRRNETRQLILSSPMYASVAQTVDLRDPPLIQLFTDAVRRMWRSEPEILRIIGVPVRDGGVQIEITMDSTSLRTAMIEYGINILLLSLFISIVTAALLFVAVRRVLVRPIQMLVSDMDRFAAAPEDARQIVQPASRIRELRAAEEALHSLELQLTQSLRQRERLAQLGEAVAKISHDLRNILTSATLLGDLLKQVDNPTVQRVAPRLVKSLGRAVTLTEGTLAFGRAEEGPPRLARIKVQPLCQDVIEGEALAANAELVSLRCEIDPNLELALDADQMHRVLTNITRNARQAIEASGTSGEICIRAHETSDTWRITITDTGPGLPEKAKTNLFKAFDGSARKGGTGLGLTIAADLVRGHGGSLALTSSDETGTVFTITLSKSSILHAS